MLTIPRSLARRFRAVLRRCAPTRGPRGRPLVLARAGPDGLTLQAHPGEVAVRLRHPGSHDAGEIALPADALAAFEGRLDTPVTLEQIGPGKGRARWDEGGVPRSLEVDTVDPGGLPPFPGLPARLAPVPPAFLAALAEAARAAAPEAARYALSRVLLRGRAGQVVATDGRQLLVQGGFALPWEDDVLVPALPLFAGKELPAGGPAAVGRTEAHVALRLGPWDFLLAVDRDGRFPRYEEVIPRAGPGAGRLEVGDGDAALLLTALPKLPGHDEALAPVTLDLGAEVVVRARAEGGGPATELVLAHSRYSGPAARVVLDRRYLLRALSLGFRAVQVVHPAQPLTCRDATRTYLWMPLDPGGAMPPADDVLRVSPEAGGDPTPPQLPTTRRKPVMPTPPADNGRPSRPGGVADPVVTASPVTRPSPERVPGLAELVAEAEAIRAALQEAHGRLGRLLAALRLQRKQARAVEAAVAALRQLPHAGG